MLLLKWFVRETILQGVVWLGPECFQLRCVILVAVS